MDSPRASDLENVSMSWCRHDHKYLVQQSATWQGNGSVNYSCGENEEWRTEACPRWGRLTHKRWKRMGVHSARYSYWNPGAKAPDHQYPQCWLNVHCTGPVSYMNIIVRGNSIGSENKIMFWKKIYSVVPGLTDHQPCGTVDICSHHNNIPSQPDDQLTARHHLSKFATKLMSFCSC